jgi:hypothetical protein
LQVVDAGGEPRELHLAVEEGGLRVTVFHRTEHALIPVNDGQGQELARWLVERVGLPPGLSFVDGALVASFHPGGVRRRDRGPTDEGG